MKPADEWDRWSQDWRQQAIVDVDRLHRRVRRKKWQMRLVSGFELLIALFATSQLVRFVLMPWVDTRWKIWAAAMFLLVAVMVCLQWYVRRGSWRTTTAGIPDLLQLTARRARGGVRLAWLNIASFLVFLAITAVAAAPWLAPARWLDNPELQHLMVVQISINGSVVVALLIFFAFYIRRQKQRLHKVETLLREYRN